MLCGDLEWDIVFVNCDCSKCLDLNVAVRVFKLQANLKHKPAIHYVTLCDKLSKIPSPITGVVRRYVQRLQ
jgi:hypothetical protein